MKTKITSLLLLLCLICLPAAAMAASKTNPCDNPAPTKTDKCVCANTANKSGVPVQSKVDKCVNSTFIVHDIQTIVNFLSALVGIVVTAVILIGGIQYIMAGGNATAVTAARQRIANGVIALFAFLFIFVFLQWLIPGGIFG